VKRYAETLVLDVGWFISNFGVGDQLAGNTGIFTTGAKTVSADSFAGSAVQRG